MIQDSFLAEIATADLCVEYDKKSEKIDLSGRWLKYRIEHTQPA